MRIFITGICGFAGSIIARTLMETAAGVQVVGMDNLIRSGSEVNRTSLIRAGARVYHGDVRCASDFEALPAADWVIDAAANPSVLAGVDGKTSSRQLVEHNLLGTVNILETCRRWNAGLILLSTSRVYSIPALASLPLDTRSEAFEILAGAALPHGASTIGISETFSVQPPLSLYGSTKLASELLALEYGERYRFPVWVNRCGVLAGASQFGRIDQGIFSYWVHSHRARKPLQYIGFGGSGQQVRDCLHPRDLVPLFMKQWNEGVSTQKPRVVNASGGVASAMSLRQLTSWCDRRFGAHTVEGTTETRLYDIPWLVLDSSLAERTWGWKPSTPTADILEEIARHAEANPDWLDVSGAS